MRANMPQQGTSLSKINMRICTHVMEFPGCEQKFDFHFNKKPEDEKKDKQAISLPKKGQPMRNMSQENGAPRKIQSG